MLEYCKNKSKEIYDKTGCTIYPGHLRDFIEACKQLRAVLEEIREIEPSAHIYVTPAEINLMVGEGDPTEEKNATETRVDGVIVPHLDCGDW